MWGVLDSKGPSYLPTAAMTSKSLYRLLETFEAHSIKCTWGVVGALNHNDITELDQVKLEAALTQRGVNYKEVFELAKICPDAFFCKDFISTLSLSGQDLISHTFHHIEMSRNGLDYLKDELMLWESALGRPPLGLIFCRNSYDDNCLDILERSNMRFYRAEPDIWYMALSSGFKKIFRYIDSFIPLWSGTVTKNSCDIRLQSKLRAVPHTLFFRTFPSSRGFMKRLHILRIKMSMLYAARFNRVVHLWCHPHNFAVDSYDISSLKEILEFYVKLNRKFNLTNQTIAELANE
jgi:peptidoglycan/xylan/chitin deacetylase (PgdA/CDA1 family)